MARTHGKTENVYICSECGGNRQKWTGQCPSCKAWNTLVETVAETPSTHRFQSLAQTAPVLSLADIEATDVPRFATGIEEFDRVLGGGLVAGGVVLIGGDPGIGKSTLLLQALADIAARQTRAVCQRRGIGRADRAARATASAGAGSKASELQLLAEIQLEKIPARSPSRSPTSR